MLLLIPICSLILSKSRFLVGASVSPTIKYGKIGLVQDGAQAPTAPFHTYADVTKWS